MKSVAPGGILEVAATDPGSVKDFKAFCQTTGDTLVAVEEADGVFVFRIRKAG
jgi:tRNA 2-thiouridine synthesizing protein A